jgi:hypothetical protein
MAQPEGNPPMRRATTLSLASALLLLSACSKKPALSMDSAEVSHQPRLGLTLATHALSAAASAGTPSDRYIAVQHKLDVASSDEKLPSAWDSVIKFCGTLQCEVTASTITARSGESSPSGSIVLRVVPEDFPKLLMQVEREGNIVQHTTLSEDKTNQVLDTEARLKNMTAYRDSLRAMLGRPGLNIKDTIEIQEKLTDVQSDLDGETAKRKILANETEKVAVEIEFRVRDASRRRSTFAPLWSALGEAGETLAESLGSVITFVVSIIPWILLFILIGWFLRRLWRKRRDRKAALAAAQTGS